MKLTHKQSEDLKACLYFVPMNCKDWIEEITDDDIASYFAWSDKGRGDFVDRSGWTSGGDNIGKTKGATVIKWGKTYRELFVTDMLRDLDSIIYIWELARDDPELPLLVVRALGAQRLKQFTTWRAIYESDTPKEEFLKHYIHDGITKLELDMANGLFDRAFYQLS